MSVPDTELRERVETALRRVEDPRLGMNVFEAGLVEAIRVDDGAVVVEAALDGFEGDAVEGVTQAIVAAAADAEGVDRAHVEPTTPSAEDAVSVAEIDTVVAVASTKGGVGKTTVATHLACALAADGDLALFDADIYGPNVPSLLGVDGMIRADEDDRPVPLSVGPIEVMSTALLTEGGPLAWRGAMAHDALTELFETTAWSDPGTMVIDLPPGTGDVALTTLQEVPVDGVVLVTTPFHTSLEDTRRSVELFEENGVPVLGTVVNMDRFTCECGREHDLFPNEETGEALDAPVLARLPFDREMQADPRPGTAPDAVEALADDVRERLDDLDGIAVPDDAVDLRGEPARRRYDLVSEAFGDLDAGERLHVVSDRDPTPAGEFLVDLLGASGPPEDALDEFVVERKGPDEWVLVAGRP
ncbi:P-loop NTPase [Halostella sp. JP-L12]|uniref:P-loop NTPase n=1 Tax=Halostella TaxID=1843185 RepID=UPI000EF80E6C|nr:MULTISPECIES: P-loop NTPase [Halostella]NHN47768.1 P-loop NTPase [Halostella sp. JP-L12]